MVYNKSAYQRELQHTRLLFSPSWNQHSIFATKKTVKMSPLKLVVKLLSEIQVGQRTLWKASLMAATDKVNKILIKSFSSVPSEGPKSNLNFRNKNSHIFSNSMWIILGLKLNDNIKKTSPNSHFWNVRSSGWISGGSHALGFCVTQHFNSQDFDFYFFSPAILILYTFNFWFII